MCITSYTLGRMAEDTAPASPKTPKAPITAADVLAWLKSQGKGYQSRINAILRREMLEQRQAQAKASHR